MSRVARDGELARKRGAAGRASASSVEPRTKKQRLVPDSVDEALKSFTDTLEVARQHPVVPDVAAFLEASQKQLARLAKQAEKHLAVLQEFADRNLAAATAACEQAAQNERNFEALMAAAWRENEVVDLAAADELDDLAVDDVLARQRAKIRSFLRKRGAALRVQACHGNPHAMPGMPLYARFAEALQRVGSKRIRLAFHGTPEENIDAICREGLDPARRSRQAMGPGGAPGGRHPASGPLRVSCARRVFRDGRGDKPQLLPRRAQDACVCCAHRPQRHHGRQRAGAGRAQPRTPPGALAHWRGMVPHHDMLTRFCPHRLSQPLFVLTFSGLCEEDDAAGTVPAVPPGAGTAPAAKRPGSASARAGAKR